MFRPPLLVAALALLFVTFIFGHPQGFGQAPTRRTRTAQFICFGNPANSQLILAIAGSGGAQSEHMILFSVCREGSEVTGLTLTKEVKLASTSMPVNFFVSPEGRYIVTLDQWKGPSDKRFALVIYDLVGDRTRAYGLSELVSERWFRSLEPHAFLRGHKWRTAKREGSGIFKGSKFYPTTPEFCVMIDEVDTENSSKSQPIPCIEVDLNGMSATQVDVHANPPTGLTTDQKEKVIHFSSWYASEKTVNVARAEKSHISLPAKLRLRLLSKNGQHLNETTFQVDTATGDYRKDLDER